jgi:hypothetical protein
VSRDLHDESEFMAESTVPYAVVPEGSEKKWCSPDSGFSVLEYLHVIGFSLSYTAKVNFDNHYHTHTAF